MRDFACIKVVFKQFVLNSSKVILVSNSQSISNFGLSDLIELVCALFRSFPNVKFKNQSSVIFSCLIWTFDILQYYQKKLALLKN